MPCPHLAKRRHISPNSAKSMLRRSNRLRRLRQLVPAKRTEAAPETPKASQMPPAHLGQQGQAVRVVLEAHRLNAHALLEAGPLLRLEDRRVEEPLDVLVAEVDAELLERVVLRGEGQRKFG